MDLQKTKEARRNMGSKQEESSEYCLEAYGKNNNSKNLPKNDSLDQPHDSSQNNESSADDSERAQMTSQSLSNAQQSTSSCTADAREGLQRRSSKMLAIPSILRLDTKRLRLLRSAKRLPPVTKETLSELDLHRIMANINLRMDANFDRDLHFKPDLDGEKGRRKRREAAEYWESMATEILIYSFCASNGLELRQAAGSDEIDEPTFEPRLPAMFETLQDVLKTLVPERDHPSVMQNLDVSLMMQQIRKGVLDLVGLATWLAGLLKTHCAPMRDEWADQMVEQINSGSEAQDMRRVVDGLRTLFGILEAMKLDVANHQIRAFRILLIEDTVPFLQEYFMKRMTTLDFPVESSRIWYLNLRRRELLSLEDRSKIDSFWHIGVLFRGLSDMLLQFDNPRAFPKTFQFDSGRLWQLRTDLQNLINLDICWYIFDVYVQSQQGYMPSQAETYITFRSRIWPLLEENDDGYREASRWQGNISSVALEIARMASVVCHRDDMVCDSVIGPIERALEWHLSQESSVFELFQTAAREKLLESTFSFAKKYLNMSPLAICESQRPLQSQYGGSVSQRHMDMDFIAMRLAHMGVLHWRVWAPILYTRDESSEARTTEDNPDVAHLLKNGPTSTCARS
ncbi:conserved hypothetical protein [Paecilomyces variotii No. 5]|uniref:cAMP-mediated signaling protein Sok1 n=1 Tax=Byssochlamys spectabilis (strain No. 5 / NBRC 109023) TaxID=1356009 RepID=V5FMS4_BYSSN|nr:conserved hypothetical protein [Paecilomyces variotii No. 5]